MNNKEKRLQFINDFFTEKFSDMIDYMENLCNMKFDFIEAENYPDQLNREGIFGIRFIGHVFEDGQDDNSYSQNFSDNVLFDENDIKENGFEDISDFTWQLTYLINKKYTTK